jgi:hypothetical protein
MPLVRVARRYGLGEVVHFVVDGPEQLRVFISAPSGDETRDCLRELILRTVDQHHPGHRLEHAELIRIELLHVVGGIDVLRILAH